MRHEYKRCKKFTTELLGKFITSRPQGASSKSIESYHYTLDNFVGYPITPEGISSYLASLSCHNGKAKFYSCLRALCNWLERYSKSLDFDSALELYLKVNGNSKEILPER
jgi:hypothetical protein